MSYLYSQIDHDNLVWFPSDTSRATLQAINISIGSVRGLRNIKVDFNYPITAIAGRNGSGKTTLLALAACAFHDLSSGYSLPGRKHAYYTFSDFFIQTSDEIPLSGIAIRYLILHNKWRITKTNRSREGSHWQMRRKRKGGRWNNYERRVNRPVVFLGIDRIVPHAEKSVSKSYKGLFKPGVARGWETEVRDIVGRILNLDYKEFEYREHSKYRLPMVQVRSTRYSGFNMGAGEDALFGMISTILDCPDGTLLVIDEIDLGLHEEAQARLIDELKILCNHKHIQIICTTHSPRILEKLPPEGRVFLERQANKTIVIPGITAAFASGKLGGRPSDELLVLVEDDVSSDLLKGCLDADQRKRLSIIGVGSVTAVMRHLAAKYIEGGSREVCVFLDGDQASEDQKNFRQFISSIDDNRMHAQAEDWFSSRVHYLPGDEWPEAWLVKSRGTSTYERFEAEFGLSKDQTIDILDGGFRAGKHNEIYEIATHINCDENILLYQLVKAALESDPTEMERVRSIINAHLEKLS
jgi:energy-coupling factor transporter ATP-binding protein EcfA2